MPTDYTQQLRQAVQAIDTLQARIASLQAEIGRHAEPIAIIGLDCRFPGASSPQEFADLLNSATDTIAEVPADRWNVDDYYDPNPEAPGKISTRFGGFLNNLDQFDAELFSVSRREAIGMDPQHRMLLETAWAALEDAGIAPDSLKTSRTGVFVGIATSDYAQLSSRVDASIDAYLGSGTAHSTAAGRISYILGLEGPNMAIDTACSSSLVALHQACQSLRAAECDIAITGGVNAIITPAVSITFSKARMLSPDGRCKTFDASADGFTRGEGCGLVILKRLSDAIRDGDAIRAVIRGSAINQDGASGGLTVPNGQAQERVIRAALKQAGIAPADVAYLEAHGTGTSLGDPIEISAAANVYGSGRPSSQPLLTGSVKTNIGHLEAAAGIAGLIKTVLSLNQPNIPASLHCRRPNPHIPWDRIAVRVCAEAQPWPQKRRIAGVSAFGFSGTNSHVLIEAAPAIERQPPTQAPQLLLVSGKTETGLVANASQLAAWIEAHPEARLDDIAHTLATGRSHMDFRAGFVVHDLNEASKQLATITAAAKTSPPRIAWLFTGQGSQYPGMVRGLYESRPVLRAVLDRCATLLREEFSFELLPILFGTDEAQLADTAITQPALYAVEIGIAELWRSWGIEPEAVMGHSVGEFAAAYVAGIVSLEDGLRLIAHRGRLMGALPRIGGMAAIFLKPDAVLDLLRDYPDLSIAAHNGGHTVVSGETEQLEALLAQAEQRGITCRPLATSHAFHSALIEPMLDRFEAEAAKIEYQAARCEFVSNVTGRRFAAGERLDATYWRRHAREAVQFANGVQDLANGGITFVLEIGPDNVLAAMARRCWPSPESVRFAPSLKRGLPESEQISHALLQLYLAGAKVDFAAVNRNSAARILHLPTYAFQRKRYWIDVPHAPAQTPIVSPESEPKGSVAAFYDKVGATPMGDGNFNFLTFGPFIQPVPGFSWLLTWAQPERFPEHARLVIEAQQKLREALFHHVPFDSTTRAMDIGCGLSSDLISLATRWPHLRLDGFTISGEQAKEGLRRAEEAGLADRVSILHADSSRDPFPSRYQLMFGFEVVHYIREKNLLFRNIEKSLEEGGLLVLADFQSMSDVRIEHAETNSYFSTLDEWVDLLSTHSLALVETIDISPEISNFLADDRFDENLATLRQLFPHMDDLVAAGNRSYHQLGRLLGRGLARYMLLTARKDSHLDRSALERHNRARLANPVPYSAWLMPQKIYRLDWQPAPASQILAPNIGQDAVFFVSGDEALADELRRRHITVADTMATATAVIDCSGDLPSLLATVQAAELPTWIVTQHAVAVLDDVPVDPAAAAVWGFGRAVARERTTVRTRLIDRGKTTAAALADEILSAGPDEAALRTSARIIPQLVVEPLPARKLQLDPDGAYLVTGGSGWLGRHTVEWLAQCGARHIFSLSRTGSAVPGCTDVLCDLADSAQLAHALDRIRATAPLRGIFHAAGITDDALLDRLNGPQLDRVFAAKAHGAAHLDQLTRVDDLHYFVLYSSLTAVLGAPGQANYVAANAFLDGLATSRRQQGLPALSVNWGLWRDGGMAERSPGATEHYARRGGRLLESDSALAAMSSLLAAGSAAPAQAVVATIDWTRFAAAAGTRSPDLIASLLPHQPAAVPSTGFTLRQTPAGLRPQALMDYLRRQLATVLLADELPDPHTGFADLGMDSLMALEFRNRIQQDLQLDPAPPTTIAFDYPSVLQLADRLNTQLQATNPQNQPISPAPTTHVPDEPIAIVGFSCRFPGADNPDAFWHLLKTGTDAATQIPSDRWNVEAFFDPDPARLGKIPTREASFVPGLDRFDAAFFGISPREAALIDPQHRVLLEASWHALEHAGIVPASLSGTNTGVFVGMSTHDYLLLTAAAGIENDPLLSTGNAFSMAAGRISHKLGLQGPCEAIDTACSSSLVAISHACDALRFGRADTALAGGVNAILNPAVMVNLSRTGMVAPGGRCRTFDASAEGYGRGEGVAIAVLKRLSDAQRDGDRIWALIRGTAVHHDGAYPGLTVPNGPAQERTIRDALTRSQVAPSDVLYLETHGTGTPLGDPIEVHAAGAVYGENRLPASPLLLGSVKTNFGHLEAAAGIAGLLKVVLSMHHDVIPPHLHFTQPNPHIAWDTLAVRVVDRPTAWPAGRRLAAVSSFGFSGTNAHLIVEAGPTRTPVAPSKHTGVSLLVLSAKSAVSLHALATSYRDFLIEHPEIPLEDVCRAAAIDRTPFEERAALIADSPALMISTLDQLARGGAAPNLLTGRAKSRPTTAWLLAPDTTEDSPTALHWAALGIVPDVTLRPGSDADHTSQFLMEVSSTPITPDELARVWIAGWNLDFVRWFAPQTHRLTLPTYPFDRKRFWFQRPAGTPAQPAINLPSPLPQNHLRLEDKSYATLQNWLSLQVQTSLELSEPPDQDMDFLELGMDSMIATELNRLIEARLGVGKLSTTVVLDHRTVAKLAAYLSETSSSTVPRATPLSLEPKPATNVPGLSFWKRFGAQAHTEPARIGPDPTALPSGAMLRLYYPPAGTAATAAGIVLCPGGGYGTLAIDTEGHQVARWLCEQGITVALLSYRVGPANLYPAAQDDAHEAMRHVRSNAAYWGLDPSRIGIMGFSAGGHLAALAATSPSEYSPSFLVLGYPVISLVDHVNVVTNRNLLGERPPRELAEQLSADRRVSPATPPTFLFHTAEDAAVTVEHSLAFYAALRRSNVPAELHIFQYGPHGAGLAPGDPVLASWKSRLIDWLRTGGWLHPGSRTACEGEVLFAGEPITFGTVTLIPLDSNASTKPISWGPIGRGRFSIPASRGPLPGPHRLEVRLIGQMGDQPTLDEPRLLEVRLVEIHPGDNFLNLDIAPSSTSVTAPQEVLQ